MNVLMGIKDFIVTQYEILHASAALPNPAFLIYHPINQYL